MSVIFVFGAGASYGESLRPIDNTRFSTRTNFTTPPLATGFFSQRLYDLISYPPATVEQDYSEVFEYFRRALSIDDPLGEGRWQILNLEDLFTTIELHRAFQSSESDAGGRLVVIRNKLIRYVCRVIATCTLGFQGENYRLVQSSLNEAEGDTVINFNYDLLFDQELSPPDAGQTPLLARGLFDNFRSLILGEAVSRSGVRGEEGLYLKMHGSLNWFQCTNARCPGRRNIAVLTDTRDCLLRAAGIEISGDVTCERCGSSMVPFLIPPLLSKPITDDPLTRAIWGHAKRRLENCSQAVLIGFSAAPTDFYAAWLLRSTLGIRPPEEVEIFVVNPQNDPGREDADQFRQRMVSIFPRGYNSDYRVFSEVPTILERIGRGARAR